MAPHGYVAQTLAHERLGEHGRRGRSVAGDVVRLLGDFLDQLGADLLVRVLELDLLGDGNTIVGDRGRAPLLLEDDVAALGAKGDLDGVGELVHPALETAPCLLVERDDLGHVKWSSRTGGGFLRTALAPATDGLPASWFLAPHGLRASPTRSSLSLSPSEC